ncbi:hypothetical protein PVAND_017231 [Polypedilum vanderplanki]|uniref:Peptidase C1A papain C-terminal domain-containing protein n=1 Tax=Polypedilum vanderplanki TaxID=319348 RepID=A0A9J6BIF4_POLVA|nr:hypothetical protein PVAND_017231 [Polypedilum vanderplanki]
MKFKILTIFFTFVLVFSIHAEDDLTEEDVKVIEEFFKSRNFTGRASRNVRTPEIEERVRNRYRKIKKHNERFKKGEEHFEQGLNDFALLSDGEIKNYFGYNPPPFETFDNETLVPIIDPNARSGKAAEPDYWNWAEQGNIVQPVQNQGGCGSCYAFAAAGALEGSMCRYFGKCVKLSEQEMMECTNGCAGGWDTWVYDYTTLYNGATGSSYSYTGAPNSCNPSARVRQVNSIVTSYKILPNDEATIRSYLYRYGPLFTAYFVYNNFNYYKEGIITTQEGEILGGHAVLITGYGTSNGIPYWIVKNSWGTNWGEKGYFRILRGKNLMNIEGWKVSFPWTR